MRHVLEYLGFAALGWSADVPSNLQFVVPLKDLTAEPVAFDLRATTVEQDELRRRFGLVALEDLAAEGTIYPLQDGAGLRVEGHLQAEVTQNCVVTLEPVVQEGR